MRRRCLVLAALLVAMMMPLVAQPQSAAAAPNMAYCVTDTGAIQQNLTSQQAAALDDAAAIGASCIRLIVYHAQIVQGNINHLNRAIAAILAHRMTVEITIACNSVHWTTAQFAGYVQGLVQQYGSLVKTWGICNEPNGPGWLTPFANTSLPATYCQLYQAAWNAIQAVDPTTRVYIGDLSSANNPLGFLQATVQACGPLYTDGLFYHAYQGGSPLLPGNVTSVLGIGAISLVWRELQDLAAQHLLTLPDGISVPPIAIDEFGYQLDATGALARLDLPDSTRAVYEPEAEAIACAAPYIIQFSHYQLLPAAGGRGGSWDTSIWTADSLPDLTGLALQQFWVQNPGCFLAQPPSNLLGPS